MSTAAVLVPFDHDTVGQLEAVVSECSLAVLEEHGKFQRTFMLAEGMKKLGEMITADMMQAIMALQGSGLGFKTDKDDKGGYPLEIVKRVTIEATLRGLNMIGNEVNIIGGNLYGTKNGMRRLVEEWPGLTHFRLHLAIPESRGGNTVVDAVAYWTLGGVEQSLERRGKEAIPVRRNQGMGEDAIHGKAKRKMYAAVYEVLAGMKTDFPEGEVADAINVNSRLAAPARSSLNDFPDEKGEDAAPPTLDAAESDKVLGEYEKAVEGAKTIQDVYTEARKAAMDKRLPGDAQVAIQKSANRRRAEIRNGRGERSNAP